MKDVYICVLEFYIYLY